MDGSTVWQVRYRLGGRGTAEHSETFFDAKAAARFAKLVDDVGAARALEVKDAWDEVQGETPYTVASWALEHVENLTGVTDAYRARCKRVIERDFAPFADLPLRGLGNERVKAWVKAMEKAGVSGKTIHNKHGLLSSIMKHALAAGQVDANPCEGVRLPETITRSMTFLSPDEFTRFIGYFTPQWVPFVSFLFGTGARFSEATALTGGDVDLAGASVRIDKAWKGATVGAPKSRRSRRTLALAPETVEILRPLVENRPASALVFTTARGTRVTSSTFHDNAWDPAVRLANGEPAQSPTNPRKRARTGPQRASRRRNGTGRRIEPATSPLGKRPRVHDARHSCASWLLAAGAPLNVVQAHMGHESITTTTAIYGHLLPSAKIAVASALSAALSAAHPQIEA